MIDSNIMRNDNQFVYQKQCAHNNMLVNIYILNTAPFIEKFVHAEIRENNVLEKEVTFRTVLDNILNKLLNNTQYTNGYRSMSCSTEKSLLPSMANIFKLTDDRCQIFHLVGFS